MSNDPSAALIVVRDLLDEMRAVLNAKLSPPSVSTLPPYDVAELKDAAARFEAARDVLSAEEAVEVTSKIICSHPSCKGAPPRWFNLGTPGTDEHEIAVGYCDACARWAIAGGSDHCPCTGKPNVPTMERVIELTADAYGLTSADLKGPQRTRKRVLARHVAMYLCREGLAESFPKIGDAFGDRDHSTVIHAVERARLLMTLNPEVTETIRQIRDCLGLKNVRLTKPGAPDHVSPFRGSPLEEDEDEQDDLQASDDDTTETCHHGIGFDELCEDCDGEDSDAV